MPDKYDSFKALEAAENPKDYEIVLERRFPRPIVIAPHGGKIEPGTSEIAKAIAGNDLSLYIFEGWKTAGNRDLHITSSRFDEPAALEILRASHFAVSVHGKTGDDEFVEVGGNPSQLRGRIQRALLCLGLEVRESSSASVAGVDPNNVINRTINGDGVQLEFSRGLRIRFCELLGTGTDSFATDLVGAIREVIISADRKYS